MSVAEVCEREGQAAVAARRKLDAASKLAMHGIHVEDVREHASVDGTDLLVVHDAGRFAMIPPTVTTLPRFLLPYLTPLAPRRAEGHRLIEGDDRGRIATKASRDTLAFRGTG